MAQLLRTAIQQAVRSVILIALPIGFLALLSWATAGSVSGDTTDPIRAAIWFIVIAHQVPLQLSLADATNTGTLSYLPLGALVIPYLALRTGYGRMIASLPEPSRALRRRALFTFVTSYTLVIFILTVLTKSPTVHAEFYLSAPIIFAVSLALTLPASGLISHAETRSAVALGMRAGATILCAAIGCAALVLAISLAWHYELGIDLTRVIEPGIFGGLALLLIQLCYLPNVAIAALGYLTGGGLAISSGTYIAPLEHRIDEIPAIPLLGALPSGPAPFALLFTALVAAGGVILYRLTANLNLDSAGRQNFFISAAATLFVLTLIAARAASGELLSSNLAELGPIWWALPILLVSQVALGAGLASVIPVLKARLRARLG